MHEDRFHFERGAIRPFQCIADGWNLIKNDYLFFLGITFVGFMLAELAPLGILMGPAFCGIHICLLRQFNGQRVSFDMLFQGFNYFGPSLIATIFIMVPMLFLTLVYLVFYFGGVITFIMAAQQQPGQPPDPTFLFGWIILTTSLFVIFALMLEVPFFFVFPLIVDRELSGWEAVRTSFRAVFSNLGGVIMMVFLEVMFQFAGLLICGVGGFLLLPLSVAMLAVAYRQVFPVQDPYLGMPPDPEEMAPAPVVVDHSPHIQAGEPRPTSVQERAPDTGSSPEANAN